MPDQTARPFPIQLEVEFLDRLSEPVRDNKAKSVSEIIRHALERFDFEDAVVLKAAQVQISVRLPAEIRKNLRRISRSKHTSVGHLVRAAVEAYLPELEALPHPDSVASQPKPKSKSKRGGKLGRSKKKVVARSTSARRKSPARKKLAPKKT